MKKKYKIPKYANGGKAGQFFRDTGRFLADSALTPLEAIAGDFYQPEYEGTIGQDYVSKAGKMIDKTAGTLLPMAAGAIGTSMGGPMAGKAASMGTSMLQNTVSGFVNTPDEQNPMQYNYGGSTMSNPIEVQGKELETQDGRILKDFKRQATHAKGGYTYDAKPDRVIIPANLRKRYMEGDRQTRRTLEANVVADQTKREYDGMYANGGKTDYNAIATTFNTPEGSRRYNQLSDSEKKKVLDIYNLANKTKFSTTTFPKFEPTATASDTASYRKNYKIGQIYKSAKKITPNEEIKDVAKSDYEAEKTPTTKGFYEGVMGTYDQYNKGGKTPFRNKYAQWGISTGNPPYAGSSNKFDTSSWEDPYRNENPIDPSFNTSLTPYPDSGLEPMNSPEDPSFNKALQINSPKAPTDWSKYGRMANTAGQLAPIAYNVIRGLQKPQTLQHGEFQNPYEEKIKGILANRSIDMKPVEDEIRNTYQIGLSNISKGAKSSGQVLSGKSALYGSRMNALAKAKMEAQNYNNQYRGDEASGLTGLGSQYAQRKFAIQDVNDRNRAARNAMWAQAANDTSEFAQGYKKDDIYQNLLEDVHPDYSYDRNARRYKYRTSTKSK